MLAIFTQPTLVGQFEGNLPCECFCLAPGRVRDFGFILREVNGDSDNLLRLGVDSLETNEFRGAILKLWPLMFEHLSRIGFRRIARSHLGLCMEATARWRQR